VWVWGSPDNERLTVRDTAPQLIDRRLVRSGNPIQPSDHRAHCQPYRTCPIGIPIDRRCGRFAARECGDEYRAIIDAGVNTMAGTGTPCSAAASVAA
jgi:hypothetical protein